MNDEFLNKYNIVNSKFNYYKLSFEELYNLLEDNENNFTILVVKDGCNYCLDFMTLLNEISDEINTSRDFFVVESTELTIEQKEKLINDYSITSVPSMLIFNNKKLSSVEIGIPTKDRLKELIFN